MQTSVNQQTIDNLKKLMGDKFPALLSTYKTKTDNQFRELETALIENDADKIIAITHSMKGSCGSMGAISMHDLCCQYEAMARKGELSDTNQWIENLQYEYNVFIEILAS